VSAAVKFRERVYRVAPTMALISEIERELGPVPELTCRFAEGRWSVCALVTLTQMMLASAGRTADWAELGQGMIEEGLEGHARAAENFLRAIIR
jgi:hypothetical protein